MKTVCRLLGCLAIVAVIGFSMTACGKDGSGGSGSGDNARGAASGLAAKWYGSQEAANSGFQMAVAYEFTADGKFFFGFSREDMGTYTVANNTITLVNGFGNAAGTAKFSISGTKLTIAGGQNPAGLMILQDGTYYRSR